MYRDVDGDNTRESSMTLAAVAERNDSLDRCAVARLVPATREGIAAARLCASCSMQPHCFPLGVRPSDDAVSTRKRLYKGATLFRAGDPFTALYAIRSGSCKTVLLTEDGREQVSAYHIRGEYIGLDGVGAGIHNCEAIALEDSEICVMPFAHLEALARDSERMQQTIHRMLASEIARERNVMLMLGTMRAEQRLAAFLLDLSRRYHARGYSSTEFVLRMTREEIGSYLGLKLETVSRLFSHMHREGLLQVQGRVVKLLDLSALQGLVTSSVQ
jgi:CRP/FNR family transcriptional regulator